MKVNVTKDRVSIVESDDIHAGEYNINNLQFSFSDEYSDNLVKNAIFTNDNGNSYQVSIINNKCQLPAEILAEKGSILFGVYAYQINEEKLELRYSPFPTRFTIISGSYDSTAEEGQEITPSQFEQYMQALNDGLNKVEESLTKMDSATSSANDLVDDINQKLENGDFIGPEGPQGIPGNDGVGITTITSGQSTVEDDKTVTPVTVQKTDGSSESFNVEAKNGINGKDGLNGKDGVNGTDGNDGVTPNLQIGTVTTLEPNEQATVTRTGTDEEPIFNFGIPKGQQGEKGQDGQPGADGQPGQDGTDGKDATINGQNTVEITTDNNITLDQQESVLKLGLNSQLIDKQDAEGTDNVFDDGLESPLFALGGDGKSEQVVTTGKNKLQITTFNDGTKSRTLNGVTANINENGTISLSGTASAETQFYLTKNDFSLESGNGYFWCNSPSVNCRFEFVASIDGEEKYLNSYSTTPNTFNITSSFVYSGSTIIVASGTSTNVTLTPMVSNGTFTEYEPYTGGQPSPSPDYPQEINSIEGSLEFTCRGKNLLPSKVNNYTSNGITIVRNEDGSFTLNGTTVVGMTINIATGITLPVGTYTNSVDHIRNHMYFSFDNIGDTMLNGAQLNRTKTFTVSKSTTYKAYFVFIDANTTFNNETFKVMVEQGSQATDYEPYQSNQVTFDLGQEKLRSVGDVKDELVVDLDTGDYYKFKNVEHLELAIVNMNNISEDYPGWLNVEKINEYYPNTNNIVGSIMQSKSNITNNGYSIGLNTIGQSSTVWLEKGKFNLTQTQWKEQYPDLVFKLDYSIPSTETIRLGTLSAEDLAKLKTFKGYNNVTVNTNLGLMNIRFTYGLDTKKYVDNKIAELSAQLIRGE